MAVPYSPLSSGEDRNRGKMLHAYHLLAKLHFIDFIDTRGNILYFIFSIYLFFSFWGFYLWKLCIDKKIT